MAKRIFLLMVFCMALVLLSACSAPPTQTPAPVNLPPPTATAPPLPTAASPGLEPTIPPTAEPAQSPPSEPMPQPTASQVAQPVSAPADCFAQARFVADVTVPDLEKIQPGTGFVKTWRLLNSGSCPWDGSYRLVYYAGEAMTAETSLALPVVQPQAVADLSIQMTAPTGGGVYTSYWQIVNPQGSVVGLAGADNPRIWVTIQVPVQMISAPAQDIPQTGPATTLTTAPAPSSPSSQPSSPPAQPASPPASVPSGCGATIDIAYTRRLIELINAERTNRGLPALRVDEQLSLAALDHTLDMSCNNFVEHYGTDGSTWFTRIQARGYSYAAAYENVAAGNPAFGGSPEWVVQTLWMNSQVHRDNILNPAVTDIGVGFLLNSSAKFVGYTTVNFASKP